MTLHQKRRHPEYVEGCFGCKASQVSILGYDKPRESGHVDQTTQKRWDKGLENYAAARKQGVQPAGTNPRLVEQAMQISDRRGTAFKADKPFD